jgi:hypothetical protein
MQYGIVMANLCKKCHQYIIQTRDDIINVWQAGLAPKAGNLWWKQWKWKVLTDTRRIVSCYAKDRKSQHLPRQAAPVRGEHDPSSTTSILELRGESLQTSTCILNFYLTGFYKSSPNMSFTRQFNEYLRMEASYVSKSYQCKLTAIFGTSMQLTSLQIL